MDTLPGAPSSASEPHPVDRVDPANSMAQPPFTHVEAAPSIPATTALSSPSDIDNDFTPAPMIRKQSEALGPATDGTIAPPATSEPVLSITLLLTTGARHPYKIDEKYLTSRNATAKKADGSFDPMQLSGYKLKELIWTDWRTEWEPKPASPSSIRLIIWGKMVDDKKMLSDYAFKLDQTNIVHMTVKPADFGEDEEGTAKHAKGGSIRRGRDTGEGGVGCRCVIL
ncbi:hypothetical protein BAUCODRAFT_152142 [Baudoinia panamericana UAMH 10762]|uniref:UBL3-like ubiquitin domain-containing protein n=1 Tax=Baudoinia panamericana (strain UAMH 10762) TaxID=717646 RepID=M2MZI8_BAUPA|nr:uncharacterized protein BAUCODRAFT_152142 [Baudoinia panamericana UAMH 10762]EMC91760.1 hypothetical protein BAUCODRAFT_152142 [Baudoinia panamericana UAMH 10762]